jgi:hypothetical protein
VTFTAFYQNARVLPDLVAVTFSFPSPLFLPLWISLKRLRPLNVKHFLAVRDSVALIL